MSHNAYRIDWNTVHWWCARNMRYHWMKDNGFMIDGLFTGCFNWNSAFGSGAKPNYLTARHSLEARGMPKRRFVRWRISSGEQIQSRMLRSGRRRTDQRACRKMDSCVAAWTRCRISRHSASGVDVSPIDQMNLPFCSLGKHIEDWRFVRTHH